MSKQLFQVNFQHVVDNQQYLQLCKFRHYIFHYIFFVSKCHICQIEGKSNYCIPLLVCKILPSSDIVEFLQKFGRQFSRSDLYAKISEPSFQRLFAYWKKVNFLVRTPVTLCVWQSLGIWINYFKKVVFKSAEHRKLQNAVKCAVLWTKAWIYRGKFALPVLKLKTCPHFWWSGDHMPAVCRRQGLTVRMLRSKELFCCCCMLMCVDNEEFDAEVSATTEPGTDDRTAIASEKMESGRPPARPQPPVCLMLMSCIVLADWYVSTMI